jgi:hypothetical protein
MPAPSGPNSHLWPSADSTSISSAATSSGNTPSPWIASTKKSAPNSCATSAIGLRARRKPLAKPTQLMLTTRVRMSQYSAICSGVTWPLSVGTRRVSTPREAKFIQGYKLVGNSSASVTMLSPGCQGNPSAMRLIPAVVLGSNAISDSLAPMSSAAARRQSASWAAQASHVVSPSSAAWASHFAIASDAGCESGATAAWSK